jgi:hypothetical protein
MSEWEEKLAAKIVEREVRIKETGGKLDAEAKGAVETINKALSEKSTLKLTANLPNPNEIDLGSNRGRVARIALDWNSKNVALSFNWLAGQSYLFRIAEPEGHLRFAGGQQYPGMPLDKAISTSEFVDRITADVVEL